MFQLTYSEPDSEQTTESPVATRLEVDLKALEEWVIDNTGDGEPFSISPRDMIALIREAIYWKEFAIEGQDELVKAQAMIEDLLDIAARNEHSAQAALGMIR